MVTTVRRYRFSSDEYWKMHEAGIFDEDSPVELISGEIVEMAAQGKRHAEYVARFNEAFITLLGRRVRLWSQSTLRLGDGDEPEPDLVLFRRDNYAARRPTPADVLLIIEIAETTVVKDRRLKAPLYPRYGIPEYWLLDLSATPPTMTVYRNPGKRDYRTAQVVRAGDSLSPLAFPDLEIDTADLLG